MNSSGVLCAHLPCVCGFLLCSSCPSLPTIPFHPQSFPFHPHISLNPVLFPLLENLFSPYMVLFLVSWPIS